MAEQEVTGKTPDELDELRSEFQEKNASDHYDFEEKYCLFSIPHQPEDYDGEERYCSASVSEHHKETDTWRCRAHKNKGIGNVDNLTPGNAKHYMHATTEFLLDNLNDAEQELFDEVMSWADVYGISEEENPAVHDDLELLAIERVRAVKTSKYILEEGETREKPIYDSEGNLADMEDDTNAISQEHRRLIGLIRDLKRELGITRKEQLKAEDRSKHADSAETTSEAMSELVSDDEKSFDIDEYE